jgi:hypothetical protein
MTVFDLNNYKLELSDTVRANLTELARRISLLEDECPFLFRVTSGYRDLAQQKRINPKALRSKHVLGCAVDIYDPYGRIWEWLEKNLWVLEKFDLYVENPKSDDDGHVHFQSLPPGSKKRVFLA